MTNKRERLQRLADQMFATWNAQDVDGVLGCYVENLVYLDPNTRGPVVGQTAMRAYLTKLFAAWTMQWQGGELFPLDETDGVTIRWNGTLAPATDPSRAIEIAGIDLVILDGDLMKRNEVYFDRSALAALLQCAP